MTASDKPAPDAAMLTGYLLGSLSAEAVEHLDELSIADEEFLARLTGVENDLVDAYVRGELAGDTVEQFKRAYLSSPLRIRKVEFAQTLLMFEQRSGSAVAAAPAKTFENGRQATSFWQRLIMPSAFPAWGFAAATLAAAALYLTVENVRLRNELSRAQNQQAMLTKQVDAQRSAIVAKAKELEQVPASQPNLDGLKTIAALLVPPTRGAGRLPILSVAPDTNIVVLLLTLESDDFPAYRVGLKEAASNQTVWNSANLEAAPGAGNKTVAVSFPARLLKQQNYVLELYGVSSSGRAEFISGYPVRVVIG
jgi:hypothetical protein